MNNLTLSETEIEKRQLSTEHLETAVKALQKDGFVVLNNAVDADHIDVLRERMLADVEKILALDDVPFQFNDGHIQQDPPPFLPYLFRDILVNDFAVMITHRMLGDGLYNSFYSGNTCLPGTLRQPLHVDAGQLWPGLKQATPAFNLVVNLPLVEMTPTNGSTELWPGTHLDTTRSVDENDIKLSTDDKQRWHERTRPLQPTVPAGGLLIRDMRLWHRGMPNRCKQPRPMIAMTHCSRWWQSNTPLQFPKGTEAIFEDSPLHTVIDFVDEPIDYINRNHKYDYERSDG